MPIRPSHSPQSMPLSEKPVRTRFGRTPAELLSSLGARVPSPYALKNGLGMMCASIRGTSSLHSLQVICAWITHNAYSLAAQFLASELHIPYTPRSIRALFALYQLPANNELTPWAYSALACVLLRGPRDDRMEYPSLQPISWTPHPQRTLLRDASRSISLELGCEAPIRGSMATIHPTWQLVRKQGEVDPASQLDKI